MDWDKEHFTLNRTYHDKTPSDFVEVRPLELINMQRVHIENYLKELTQELRNQENAHRENYRGTIMKEFFNGYGYCFEKIGTHFLEGSITPFQIACSAFKELERNVKKFTDELESRGIRRSLPGVTTTLNEVEHPMHRLKQYFIDEEDLDVKDMLSFTRHFEILIEELIDMAKEIDNEYNEEL